MRKLHELTPCQKQYAEDHINLVYKFLHNMELSVDEFYDIVIFGYLAAVQEFDEKPELANRCAFTTIAWQQMKNCLCEHYTYLNRAKRKTILLSIHSEDTVSLDALLPDRKRNIPDTVSDRQYLQELMSHLTHKEREVVLLKAQGMTYSEIAVQCGITSDGVGSRFARLRQRLERCIVA